MVRTLTRGTIERCAGYVQCQVLGWPRLHAIAQYACGLAQGGPPAASCQGTSTTSPPSSPFLPAGSLLASSLLFLMDESTGESSSLSGCSSQLEKGGLASGGNDGVINIWDLDAPADPVMTLVGHEKPVVALAAAPNGLLVSGSWSAHHPSHSLLSCPAER
jgi:hypothetical protein